MSAPKIRVLILGRSGMLGHTVFDFLSSQEDCEVDATHRLDDASPLFLDVESNPEAIEKILFEGNYKFVINCIGVLNAECVKTEPEKMCHAIKVNAVWPHLLVQKAAESNNRVIHMSTDGIFSGNSDKPYKEICPVDCEDAYGQSKALGESFAGHVLNIRCSIIGKDPEKKRGLVAWFLSLAENSKIDGYHHHFWNGVTTLQFAQLCNCIIRDQAFQRLRKESPIHHFCPNPPITKYQLLCILARVTQKCVTIRKVESEEGRMSRILATEFSQLKALFPNRDQWEDVICEMDLNQPEAEAF